MMSRLMNRTLNKFYLIYVLVAVTDKDFHYYSNPPIDSNQVMSSTILIALFLSRYSNRKMIV